MLKIIIVDDERAASELIASCLNKSELDVEIAGIFENATDALDFARKNEIDIVMTDIKMPGMDGLELTKILKEDNPSLKVVIFSGYDEFEFAQKAISYGVSEYLLKPVNLKEMFACIKKISEQIKQEKIGKPDFYPEMREEFLNDLTMGIITDYGMYTKKFDMLSFPFEKEDSAGVVFSVEYSEDDMAFVWKYGRGTLLTAVTNVIEKNILSCHIYPLEISKGAMRFILVGDKNNIDKELIETEIKTELGLDIKIEIFMEFENLWKMSADYPKNVSKGKKLSFLVSQIVTGNELNADIILKDVLKDMKEDDKKNFISQLTKLLSIEDNGGINVKNIIETCKEKQNSDLIIEKACQYIGKNYMKDITRDDVADYVFMNSSYFSRYFSKKVGISFYDYLVNIRMQKAMELLKTNKKIADIGEKVGYQYQKYFIKNFKRHTGYTPSDYRKYILKIEDHSSNED